MHKKELIFVVFVLHALADAWNKYPRDVYKILNQTHILDSYIISQYDILHTLSKEYLVEDITDYVKELGVQI